MLTGFQLRAAIATSGFTAKHIAKQIGVHEGTIGRLCETKNLEYLSCNVRNMIRIKTFFENKGINFSPEHTISLCSSKEIIYNPDKLTRFQLKAARIATSLTQEELSFYIKVSSSTLSLAENLNNYEYVELPKINIPALKRFFEHIGIAFPHSLTVSLIKDPQPLVKKNQNSN